MYSHTYETNLFIHQKTQQENFNFSYIALCQVLFCTFSQITTQLLLSDGIFFPFGPDSDIVVTSQWSQVDLLLYTHIRTPAIHTFKNIAMKTCFWSFWSFGLLFTLSRIKTRLQQNVFVSLHPILERTNTALLLLLLLLLCMSCSGYPPPWILKQGGLESSGQTLIS